MNTGPSPSSNPDDQSAPMTDGVDSPVAGAGAAAGVTDLAVMLNTLTVSRRDGVRHVVNLTAEQWSQCLDDGAVPPGVDAVITESGEGTVTVICSGGDLAARGWRSAFAGVWLTLDVHSSLLAVGLTAAVSTALARSGIPANMISGYHHDHILVPEDQAEAAIACLRRLRRGS